MTTPERSVDEIVEEGWEKHTDYFKTDNGDEPFVYEDKLKKDIAQTLKAERQKREKMVEVERERIALIVRSIDFEVRQTDVRVEAAIWQSIKNLKETVLQALTHANNQK